MEHAAYARGRFHRYEASRTDNCGSKRNRLDPSNRRISIIVQYLRGEVSAQAAPATHAAKPVAEHVH